MHYGFNKTKYSCVDERPNVRQAFSKAGISNTKTNTTRGSSSKCK
jgi:hypothetical protein